MVNTSTQIAVEVKDLTKTFRIPTESSSGVKQKLINFLKGKKGYREFTPLNDTSFIIEDGDFFGIVGRNGSGKSTLLKTIAGIYTPTSGSIQVNGVLVPFIELGVGFNPELTGRENVFLNGSLLGFSHPEMKIKYDEIVKFAEIEDFMDEKLKNYSSGMQVRLAFSIAIQAKADILLLDEVLAVGDEAFQRKCYNYFSDLKQNKKTVILVTHDMSAIERYCNKAIMIEKGKIVKRGTNLEVAEAYRELFINDAADSPKSETKITKSVSDVVTKVYSDETENQADSIKILHPFVVEIKYNYIGNDSPGAVGISIRNSQGVVVIATGTGTIYDHPYTIHKGINTIKFTVEENILTNDSYSTDIAIAKGEQDGYQELIFQQSSSVNFRVAGTIARPHSLIHPTIKIKATHD
jgi:ABC-2 type transport system ATP-binding protein